MILRRHGDRGRETEICRKQQKKTGEATASSPAADPEPAAKDVPAGPAGADREKNRKIQAGPSRLALPFDPADRDPSASLCPVRVRCTVDARANLPGKVGGRADWQQYKLRQFFCSDPRMHSPLKGRPHLRPGTRNCGPGFEGERHGRVRQAPASAAHAFEGRRKRGIG